MPLSFTADDFIEEKPTKLTFSPSDFEETPPTPTNQITRNYAMTPEQIRSQFGTSVPDKPMAKVGTALLNTIRGVRGESEWKDKNPDIHAWREGMEESVAEGLDSLTTPSNLALMGVGGVLTKGAATIGGAAAKWIPSAVSAGFTYLLSKNLPDIWDQLQTELKKPDKDQKAIAKLITSGVSQLGLAGLAAAGTVAPFLPKRAAVPPVIPPEAKPSVTETTPPVEPPKTPSETGFYPAIRLVGGEVAVGKAGETHPDIIARDKIKAEDIDQRGFVDEQGKFHDREQTAAATGLPTQQEPARQHSTDLPEAQEIKPTTQGVPSAETIRGDKGQLPAPGQVPEGSQAPSGDDIQRQTSGPPNAPAQEGQAGRKILLGQAGEKGAPDIGSISAKLFSDFKISPASLPKDYRSLDVPTRKAVELLVLRSAQDPEIFRSVISSIPVDVMNDVLRKKGTPKDLFRNSTVFINYLTSNKSKAIRSRIVDPVLRELARVATEHAAAVPGLSAAGVTAERRTAAETSKLGQHEAKSIAAPDVPQAKALSPQRPDPLTATPPPEAPPITGEGAALGITPQAPKWLADIAKKAGRTLLVARKSLAQRIRSRPERHVMDQTADAIDNAAMILGRQMGKRISIGVNDVQDRAASAVIAAKFDPSNLADLLTKATKGKNADAANAVRYAQKHWPEVEAVAKRGQAVFDWQLREENSHGINTLEREDYLPGVYDTDLWMGHGRPYMTTGGSGLSTAFKKGKTYDSPFHAIEDGFVPRTLKLSELVEHRVKAGQRLINRVEWADSLRDIVDPTDKKPIVASLQKRTRGEGLPGYEVAPVGYVRKTVIPGVDIAVHEDYAKLFDALTGTSKVGTFEPVGIPVGQAALEIAGGIKHGLLLFDTFHVSRIGQKQMSLKGGPSYRKGLTLLDYSNLDLDRAVQAGEITKEMADYAKANRPQFQMLLKAGLNVGRVQEAMYSSIARAIPGIGHFNKWVFEKMTRGAMAETGLIEFERVKKENPKLSDEQVAGKIARDINQLFGNLGRQGIFKDQTFLDLSRLVFLAPQWVESMARTELRSLKAMTIDPALKGQIPFIQARGSIGRSMRNGLLAYFVGTQLLNLATRGQFTWQNQEKDHKLDAWIPDVTGQSKGFFLSPFSVFAELTHDLLRYSRSEPDVASALSRIASNKLSPFARAEEVLRTGRDWDRQKIIGSWERAKRAAWALAPTPIPLSAPIRAAGGQSLYPGQTQRQLTASAGIKTEPAESAQNQVRDLAKTWLKDSPIPALRAKYERGLKEEFGDSDYKPLRTALIKQDYGQARRQLEVLLETKTAKTILQTMRPLNQDGLPRPFTGSRLTEKYFIRSLSPQQRDLYQEAIRERIEMYRRFQTMLKQGQPAP